MLGYMLGNLNAEPWRITLGNHGELRNCSHVFIVPRQPIAPVADWPANWLNELEQRAGSDACEFGDILESEVPQMRCEFDSPTLAERYERLAGSVYWSATCSEAAALHVCVALRTRLQSATSPDCAARGSELTANASCSWDVGRRIDISSAHESPSVAEMRALLTEHAHARARMQQRDDAVSNVLRQECGLDQARASNWLLALECAWPDALDYVE